MVMRIAAIAPSVGRVDSWPVSASCGPREGEVADGACGVVAAGGEEGAAGGVSPIDGLVVLGVGARGVGGVVDPLGAGVGVTGVPTVDDGVGEGVSSSP